ncbi:MAG: 30S ribosomal protein S18 [Candidatus Liptonbacteria bacterium GWC1_60_9]|uniref:Small ribosomal subunit protein bS18 n=3 Tax=Candidatus Liptoniibacteriota TaxID=1817909 RepID=A0A1G2CL65_9BACT|nr:MAG: 30S ribosomal protein S18 [Candidatus Liptonbacteria bacterium GWC1_60_9]OGY99161.1 MAG: 30S ribosomal protein S18 [Candidatus Liptonbacteria bacterium RIFCSPHIGHO2_12_FULL_60_13]OGZ02143.1 MAG: 30S ribosomal protein S18 [Candidatus Liptonbacteria bacterium RIFCSPLOWO2_12_FULL_60_15]
MMQCYFCSQNLNEIDYKESELLKRFISGQGKIIDPKYSSTCAKHQRRLAQAIKRARFLGLLPFVRR